MTWRKGSRELRVEDVREEGSVGSKGRDSADCRSWVQYVGCRASWKKTLDSKAAVVSRLGRKTLISSKRRLTGERILFASS